MPHGQNAPITARPTLWAGALALLLAAACATQGPPPRTLYSMPSDPSLAISPSQADPNSAPELAEAALSLLDPSRAGGPDYNGAARLCLMAADVAYLPTERTLQRACFRVAAGSALRAGDRDMYQEAVRSWAAVAPLNERAAGELSLHLAISDRLNGEERPRTPRELESLIAGRSR